jgi:hypothetical protein
MQEATHAGGGRQPPRASVRRCQSSLPRPARVPPNAIPPWRLPQSTRPSNGDAPVAYRISQSAEPSQTVAPYQRSRRCSSSPLTPHHRRTAELLQTMTGCPLKGSAYGAFDPRSCASAELDFASLLDALQLRLLLVDDPSQVRAGGAPLRALQCLGLDRVLKLTTRVVVAPSPP